MKIIEEFLSMSDGIVFAFLIAFVAVAATIFIMYGNENKERK